MSRKKSGLMAQWRRGDYFLPVVRKVAELFIKTYGRILAPGLSALDPHLPEELTARSSLSTAWRCFERALPWFGDPGPRLGTPWEKGERLA